MLLQGRNTSADRDTILEPPVIRIAAEMDIFLVCMIEESTEFQCLDQKYNKVPEIHSNTYYKKEIFGAFVFSQKLGVCQNVKE